MEAEVFGVGGPGRRSMAIACRTPHLPVDTGQLLFGRVTVELVIVFLVVLAGVVQVLRHRLFAFDLAVAEGAGFLFLLLVFHRAVAGGGADHESGHQEGGRQD